MIHKRRFWTDEKGQDIVEYALLAAFISIVAVQTIKAIGPLVAILLSIHDSVRLATSR